jgi:hypothetical protein
MGAYAISVRFHAGTRSRCFNLGKAFIDFPIFFWATRSSYWLFRLSQNSALVSKKWAKRKAVSPNDGALHVQNARDSVGRHFQLAGELGGAHAECQMFPRMYCDCSHHVRYVKDSASLDRRGSAGLAKVGAINNAS